MKQQLFAAAMALAFAAGTAHASLANGQPYPVSVDAKGFLIDGEYKLLRGGTVQWFRIPQAEWRDRLQRFKAAGFNTVDLYVAWNVVEPQNNQFNFLNLRAFLQLCKEMGLYVYFRPGPYITNEMDGGGIPGWLMAISTKKDIAADGKPNLRTADPDYLAYAGRYLRRLNAEVRDFFADQGGPIILYSLENEYNWFQPFHEADKLFGYQGGPERGLWQVYNPQAYFTALRDIVRNDGITVPLTTCPGDGKASATGDVPGIIPVPNIYNGLGGDLPERTAIDLLTDMHNPANHGGAYVNMPSGTTETDRDPVKIKRLLLGGLDATFAFNAVGMMTPGYRNALVLNTRDVRNAFDFSTINNIMNGFVSPQVGYFHGVVDYYGPVSPSGILRPSFHGFRRDNLFFDAVEPYFAPAGTATSAGYSIANTSLGALENGTRRHYWLQGAQGVRFLGVVNQSGSAQVIGLNGISLNGQAIPRYVPMTVPVNPDAPPSQFGTASNDYAMLLVQDLPIANAGKLAWTTSELLTLRDFNGDALLIVHGAANGQGELVLDGLGAGAQVLARDNGITIAEAGNGRLALTYTHTPHLELVVQAASGRKVRVVVTTSDEAGRFWFPTANGQDLVVAGPDYLNESAVAGAYSFSTAAEYDSQARPLFVMSPRRLTIASLPLQFAWDPVTRSATLSKPTAIPALTPLPSLMRGKAASDTGEASPAYDTSTWTRWTGEPQPLESKGITAGHAWYRAEINFDHAPYWWEDASLYVEHASDIVGIYVNGTYLSTQLPLGTELDSDSWNGNYQFPSLKPYLKAGRNVIAFRTEIWGHGSFMWPRGTLAATNMKIPALGFDSVKGLFGTARIGGNNLTNWSVRAGLGGERSGLMNPGYNDSGWAGYSLPMTLAKGEVRWYRTTFDAAQLPSLLNQHAPLSLRLGGERMKATIWLNGQLIGRWMSGDGWIGRGFWGRAIRDMWMNTDPDYFPISRAGLRPAGMPNTLAIAFEDVSGGNDAAGRVAEVALAYSPEIRGQQNGQTVLLPQPRGRMQLTLDFLE